MINEVHIFHFDNLSIRIIQGYLKFYQGLHLPLGIYLFLPPLLSSLSHLFQVNNPSVTFLLLSFYFSLAAVLQVCHFRDSKMESLNILLSLPPHSQSPFFYEDKWKCNIPHIYLNGRMTQLEDFNTFLKHPLTVNFIMRQCGILHFHLSI